MNPAPGAWTIEASCGRARAGVLQTAHAALTTPRFMPVGTQGSVKTLDVPELLAAGADVILANTYHLWLRPGLDLLREHGGLRRLMRWPRALLTDSGGFQVWSLSALRRIDDEGVTFRSHLDGSTMRFTPASVLDAQRAIGADIVMALDECTPAEADIDTARVSWERTLGWTRSMNDLWRADPTAHGHPQLLFPIVQGALHQSLREESCRALTQLDPPGIAIGGLSVGEPEAELYRMASVCDEALPTNLPRYVMGVGTPRNLLELVDRGIDLFDCVMPTRNARNGMVFTWDGAFHHKAARWARDERPIDSACPCPACARGVSRAWLRHLHHAGEPLAMRLATAHNITFYLQLMTASRQAILGGQWPVFKAAVLARMEAGEAVRINRGGRGEVCTLETP